MPRHHIVGWNGWDGWNGWNGVGHTASSNLAGFHTTSLSGEIAVFLGKNLMATSTSTLRISATDCLNTGGTARQGKPFMNRKSFPPCPICGWRQTLPQSPPARDWLRGHKNPGGASFAQETHKCRGMFSEAQSTLVVHRGLQLAAVLQKPFGNLTLLGVFQLLHYINAPGLQWLLQSSIHESHGRNGSPRYSLYPGYNA